MTVAKPLFYLHTPNDGERWQALFAAELPDFDVVAAPAEVDPARVQYLATWRPPEGLFGRFANLRAVFALGAGIDRFLQRSDLAPGVALVRLTDAGMAQQMCEYVLAGVLRYQRDLDRYARQQADALWQPLPGRAAAELRVTVLGLGEKLWMVDSTSVWSSSDAVNWERVTSRLPWRPRAGMSIGFFDGKLWAMGGLEGTRLRNDIWFSTDGAQWRNASEKASWSPRRDARLVVFDRKLWLIGGNDEYEVNDVWYSRNGVDWIRGTDGAAWPPRPLQPLLDLVDRKFAHSLRFVLPKITAPAARSRSTTPASRPAIEPSSASEPAVVVMRSAVSMLSLMTIGMPCSGPRAPFA